MSGHKGKFCGQAPDKTIGGTNEMIVIYKEAYNN